MPSGRLKYPIEVQEQPQTQDSRGKLVESYKKIFNARANIKILSGTEVIKSGLQLGSEYVSILMRYDKRLKYDHLVLWENNHYTVEVIRPDEKRMYMTVQGSREILHG